LEKSIFKCLKNLHPDLKLPKSNEGLENFFQQFESAFKQYSAERDNTTQTEIENLRSANEDLKKQLAKSSNGQEKSVCFYFLFRVM